MSNLGWQDVRIMSNCHTVKNELPAPDAANTTLHLSPAALSQDPPLGHPFPRFPGETPRAYAAFRAFFELGHARSLQAVADKLGETIGSIKNWSSRYDWTERIHAFNSGLLQRQAESLAETERKHAADWTQRLARFREQQWDVSQKLVAAAQCFLESFGEEDVRRMTLAQVSHALRISSDIARFALTGTELPVTAEPSLSPAQQSLMDAFQRVYGQPATSPSAQAPAVPANAPVPQPTTN